MRQKLSVNNLGTLVLGSNSALWMVDFPYVAVTGVLTVTDLLSQTVLLTQLP